jgi:tetratricopeptide (TPR) repeat protein
LKIRLDAPLALLVVSMFLAPILGGQVSNDASVAEGLFDALFGGAAAPLLTHALLYLPIAIAMTLLCRRQVVQVPNTALATTLCFFFGLLSATVLVSAFRFTSLATAAQWLAYAIAFLVTVGASGRKTGPQAIMGALFAGCVVMSMRGLMEYGAVKAEDPTWRIFAGWINPNATAGMLLVGFFAGLVTLATAKDRLVVLLSGVGMALVGLALALTQSKGALAVLIVVLAVFLILILTLPKGEAKGAVIKRSAGSLVAIIALAALVQVSAKAPAGGGASGGISRVVQAQATSEQSAGFRLLLWKGALDLIKRNPAGYGIGAYGFESSRTGRHTQTVYAHQSFLQLATEGSFVLPALLFLAGALWIRLIFRGWSKLPTERRIVQAGIFAAVGAVVGHSFVDSDLYYFGIGLSFFVLLGLGLLLSGDAVAPEYAPKPVRWAGSAGATFIALLLAYVGYVEYGRSEARGLLLQGNRQGATQTLAGIRGLAPFDGEAWYQSARAAGSREEMVQAAEKAAEYKPTPRIHRFLAQIYDAQDRIPEAMMQLRNALVRDPNNLPALSQLAALYAKAGNESERENTLRRLIRVEDTEYFKVRSIPELVFTQTYEARILLARKMKGREKVAMLQPAIDGYLEYVARTVPSIKRQTMGNPNGDFSGETVDGAKAKLQFAADAALELAADYRALGDAERAKAADDAAGVFTGAFDK